MRGRPYPRPRERYDRFRLNPYSPLYQDLAFFVSVPLFSGFSPDLYGPYAPPGTVHSDYVNVVHRFFPEIGRAAVYGPASGAGGPGWMIALPPQEIITLTVLVNVQPAGYWKVPLALVGTSTTYYTRLTDFSSNIACYGWRNVDSSWGIAINTNATFPTGEWFIYSGTFRPGSVSGYLSNWGIIDTTLDQGVWPTTIEATQRLVVPAGGSAMLVSDCFVHLRELSLTELHAISDFGNVDYRMPGEAPLILPVRTYWPSVLPVAPSYLKRRSLGVRVGTREAAL
jgi:hypothetical protein